MSFLGIGVADCCDRSGNCHSNSSSRRSFLGAMDNIICTSNSILSSSSSFVGTLIVFGITTSAFYYYNHYIQESIIPKSSLKQGTSRDANERICTVNSKNKPYPPDGSLRKDMRLQNLWHRATYIIIRYEPIVPKSETNGDDSNQAEAAVYAPASDETQILVLRRSMEKDYCPGRYDPFPGGVVGHGESYEENALRELEEEMGIDALLLSDDHKMDDRIKFLNGLRAQVHSSTNNKKNATIQRMFTFPYEDSKVRVWGELFEVMFHGIFPDDITIQTEEVSEVRCMSHKDIETSMSDKPNEWMPDAIHAMKLYKQHSHDCKVLRRSETSLSLDEYKLRPPIKAIFFDCDDTLYFDNWHIANQITTNIDKVCTSMGLPSGEAYELYKRHGTAIRGLLEEGWMSHSQESIDDFLHQVHSNIDYSSTLKPDIKLREMLESIHPHIPKYIFTASIQEHAERCLDALGIRDCFMPTIIDTKLCKLHTKHSPESFDIAMKVASLSGGDEGSCLFLDDSLKNIQAANNIGWRCILVGTVGRDCGSTISAKGHAEHDIEVIHDLPHVFPELFTNRNT